MLLPTLKPTTGRKLSTTVEGLTLLLLRHIAVPRVAGYPGAINRLLMRSAKQLLSFYHQGHGFAGVGKLTGHQVTRHIHMVYRKK